MEVIVHGNREVCPNRLFVGNQYENKIEKVKFSFPDYEGYHYLIINKSGESYAVPLLNDVFYVDSLLTFKSGIYESHAVISGKKLEQTTEIDGSVLTFISNPISLIVKKNKINAGSLSEAPLPQNLQIVYDQLFNTYEQIKSDYDSGAFNGKDGYSPTLDVTPIENGNRITINDINGEKEIDVKNGIDGKSAYELAVKNGFEGTEQEWLESLRYDHSDEFEKLAEQVKQDANSAADSATKAESAMNEANTTAQENVEAINQASTDAQNAITTVKDTAVQAVDTAKTSATTEINEQKESAVSAITQEKNSATEAIETGKTDALTDIATDKTGALNDIETAKDNAIEEIENTGVPLEDVEKIAIKETVEGNPTIISDSADWRLQNLNVYGQSGQDGTPTPENPVEIISKEVSEIKVTGVNILKLENIEEATRDGITYSVENGLIKVKGTAERDYFIQFHVKNNHIALLAGQTYIFNPNPIKGTETLKMYLDFTNGYTFGFSIASNNVNISKTLNKTETDYTYVLRFIYKTGQTVDMEYKPQVLMSSVLLPYEPYKSQTITLAEPITLRGIPVSSGGNVTIDGQQYISDIVTEKDGVVGVERKLYDLSLTSSLQWTFDITTNHKNNNFQIRPNIDNFPMPSLNDNPNHALCLSNYLKFTAISYDDVAENLPKIYTNASIYNGVEHGEITISFPPDSEFNTLESFKNWLDEKGNVKVIYILNVPTFEPLPEDIQAQYKALKSYYPNTVIQTGCWNEVEFVADTKTWLENKINGVTELALGIGGK